MLKPHYQGREIKGVGNEIVVETKQNGFYNVFTIYRYEIDNGDYRFINSIVK